MDGWNAILIQKKTAVIFTIQEQITEKETRGWKKLKGIGEVDIFRLCGEKKETLQHLSSG